MKKVVFFMYLGLAVAPATWYNIKIEAENSDRK